METTISFGPETYHISNTHLCNNSIATHSNWHTCVVNSAFQTYYQVVN